MIFGILSEFCGISQIWEPVMDNELRQTRTVRHEIVTH